MADILWSVSIVSYILAGFFFMVSIFLWIKFKIPMIIGDLSGRHAKKSIAKMREENEKSGIKAYRSSVVNLNRGKITTYINGTDKLKKNRVEITENLNETGILNENKNDGSGVTMDVETGILNDKITETLDGYTIASLNEESIKNKNKIIEEIEFKIIDEVILIHTNEVIEY